MFVDVGLLREKDHVVTVLSCGRGYQSRQSKVNSYDRPHLLCTATNEIKRIECTFVCS